MPDSLARDRLRSRRAAQEDFSDPVARDIAQLKADVNELRQEFLTLRHMMTRPSLKRSLRRLLAKCLFMRLHLHVQYEPRELTIPRSYWEPLPLENPPGISIVIPSYNLAPFRELTMRSILNQKYERLEYVIHDDGFSERTRSNPGRRRQASIESSPDVGQAEAINRGFAQASGGEIMAAISADDILLPGSLNYVAAYFAAHPEVDVVYGHRVIIDDAGQEVGRWVLPPHSDRMLAWANYVPAETLFWRRRIWEKAGGGMNDAFQVAFDWELLLRFRSHGAKFVRLPRFLGAFRLYSSQMRAFEHAKAGPGEMERLRSELHGRPTDLNDIRRNLKGYMLRHAWQNFLYRVGLGGE